MRHSFLLFFQKGETKELFNLDMPKHGWERFGENHTDTVLGGYIEGPWLTKHNGKYYMQYGAPGTEFNVYADGVYVADHPMGPYTYQKHNPVSYKTGWLYEWCRAWKYCAWSRWAVLAFCFDVSFHQRELGTSSLHVSLRIR